MDLAVAHPQSGSSSTVCWFFYNSFYCLKKYDSIVFTTKLILHVGPKNHP